MAEGRAIDNNSEEMTAGDVDSDKDDGGNGKNG
jgi:hypothetical protein